MDTSDKKPDQNQQPGQRKQQGDNHQDRQQQGQHPADKGKTHDTTRDPQPKDKETGYPPVNDPTGGPRRNEQQR
jgi:hypothetical protein